MQNRTISDEQRESVPLTILVLYAKTRQPVADENLEFSWSKGRQFGRYHSVWGVELEDGRIIDSVTDENGRYVIHDLESERMGMSHLDIRAPHPCYVDKFI